jgi:hypothetical protein
MRRLRRSTLALALLLAGCAGTGVAPTAAPTPPAAVAPALAAEQHWLEDLFRGTPVTVGPGPNASLRLEVPLKYAFDAGQVTVKPPLAAVLDKVAASLARQSRARLQAAVPAPTGRADGVRDHLVARGVAGYRIERLPPRADAVELRLLVPPRPVERLDDPPPAAPARR